MILFAHGLEGSPHGSKVRALRAAGLDVHAPDFSGLALADRVALLESEIPEGEPVVLAGSSYGGLAAAIVAARRPARFRGLLLCAPAFNVDEPPAPEPGTIRAPDGLPVILVHGVLDDVVPVEGSRRYRDRSGPNVVLREVRDGHRLSASLDAVVAAARELDARPGAG